MVRAHDNAHALTLSDNALTDALEVSCSEIVVHFFLDLRDFIYVLDRDRARDITPVVGKLLLSDGSFYKPRSRRRLYKELICSIVVC